ncbi:MAG: peptidoglycan DD-metalloendopeptidase family protein [Oscillospiraceae bacterium]
MSQKHETGKRVADSAAHKTAQPPLRPKQIRQYQPAPTTGARITAWIDRKCDVIHGWGVAAEEWVEKKAGQTRHYLGVTHRRVRRAAHEKRARRFPESDQLPVQLFLLVWGMLPMLGGHLRAATWGIRRRGIHAFGRLRSRVERLLDGRKLHPAAFLGSAACIAAVALFFSAYTFGTVVKYDGAVVGSVGSPSAIREACDKLEQVTAATLGSGYTMDKSLLQYSSGVISRKSVVDEQTIEAELSDEIGLVTYGYALYVNGELIGATPYEGALEELLEQLKSDCVNENTISCDFNEETEIRAEYVPQDKIMNLGYLAEILGSTKAGEITYTVAKGDTWSQIAEKNNKTSSELQAMNPGYNIDKIAIGEVLTISNAVPYLSITLTQRECYLEDVPYEVEYQDSAYLYQGDYDVLSAGSYGSADVVANVTYVNGEEIQRDILSYETLVDPITEQQARGTKERPTWIATGNFRWPCSGRISSRFGYRNLSYSRASSNHKGIDIANGYGTAICAADGGTVVYSGWMSGYGYLIQIDHGNGYTSYYGHNSSLSVSVGQHVYKGQQVARMGSTGNSTGNHCHFEIRYKGVPKNPLNFI